MLNPTLKKVHLWYLMSLLPLSVAAEGIVDVRPYISTNVNYDDNVYRFSSPSEAIRLLGSSATSDVAKRIDLGVNVNLRLSRQLISLSANINKTDYNRFNNLDNTGKSNSLQWDWKLGSKLYGVLSASQTESVAGFNEARTPVKNLRTVDRKSASINWDLHPDWTIHFSREQVEFDNAAATSRELNREDNVTEGGIRYQSQLDTRLGLAYRVVDSTFPGRTGLVKIRLGDDSSQKELIASAEWAPTFKTKIAARLSRFNLVSPDVADSDRNGFSQRWDFGYRPTDKVNLNLAAFHTVSPQEDVISTYVKTTGFELTPNWNLTSKVGLRGNLGYQKIAYIGSAGVSGNSDDRSDVSRQVGLSLYYTPTLKSLVQLQYQGEKRTSNISNLDYVFNNLNFFFRYDF
jgi:exopolysaccharide biosynthesis operon protein EpsL